jgi:hypothetical protein
MEAQTPQEYVKAASHLGAAIADADAVKRDKTARRTTDVRETSMHALRRILGDEVLDVFPEGIVDTTDALFEEHAKNKDAWADVTFETASDRNDALALLRAYAECADDPGYTIRQDRTTEPNVLRFRVVVRKGSGGDEE